MRHLIPFRPLINLLLVLIEHRGIAVRQWTALLPWLVKTILFEPFRWLEAVYVCLRSPFVKPKPPIFILGFYRSGTTWLQQLMSTDPDFKTPSIFQTVLPEFMFVLEPVLKPLLQWLSKGFKMENQYHRLPFDWDFPGEEDVAINALSYRVDFNRIYQYPSFADQLIQKHFTPKSQTQQAWAKAHQYYVKKLSLKYPNQQLILKSPPNTGRVALLKALYPQAKFIFIKRAEQVCLQSYKRLWTINRPFSFEEYTAKEADIVAQKLYQQFHLNYERDKASLAMNQLAELDYEDFIKAPLAHLDRVYEQLELGNTPEKQQLKQQLIDARADYRPVQHKID